MMCFLNISNGRWKMNACKEDYIQKYNKSTKICLLSNLHYNSYLDREYIIIDHSDVIGASPVGAAPTTSSFLI